MPIGSSDFWKNLSLNGNPEGFRPECLKLYRGGIRFLAMGLYDFTDIEREDFRNLLGEIGRTRMPFGKFGIKEYPPAGVPIMDLPEEYLVWFKERGFPKGRLGELMAHVCEIKSVGMDAVFDPLRQAAGGRFRLRVARRRSVDFD